MVVKGYSRDTEFEADRVGLKILADAGYDPRAFIRLLETLDKEQGSPKGGGFSATHPSAKDRIAKLTAEAAKLDPRKVPKVRKERFAAAIANL
jgi:predicted Zn-dependent protease